VRTQQDNALAPLERLVQVFQAVDSREPEVRGIVSPACDPHFDQRHAQRLEMSARKLVMLGGCEFREAQLEVAASDCPAFAGQSFRQAAKHSADGERYPVWEQTNRAQHSHSQPGRPVTRGPVEV
jgi:transposase InsO family protein